jgi:hypothetical protein
MKGKRKPRATPDALRRGQRQLAIQEWTGCRRIAERAGPTRAAPTGIVGESDIAEAANRGNSPTEHRPSMGQPLRYGHPVSRGSRNPQDQPRCNSSAARSHRAVGRTGRRRIKAAWARSRGSISEGFPEVQTDWGASPNSGRPRDRPAAQQPLPGDASRLARPLATTRFPTIRDPFAILRCLRKRLTRHSSSRHTSFGSTLRTRWPLAPPADRSRSFRRFRSRAARAGHRYHAPESRKSHADFEVRESARASSARGSALANSS